MIGLPLLLVNLQLFVSTGALAQAAWWWLLWLALGLLFLPLAATLFRQFPDRGYVFARVLGLCLAGYLTWLAASLGWVGFSRGSALGFAVGSAVACWALWLWAGQKRRLALPSWRTMAQQELVFLVCLVGWSFVRTLSPELHSLEKAMDFGFINACLHSATMPPADPWWAGGTINYYYFGHFLCAWLLKLWGTDPGVGYNLLVASFFALVFGQAYSLARALAHISGRLQAWQGHLAGLISACLCALGGTLHTFIFGVVGRSLYRMGWHDPAIAGYRYSDATRYIGHNPPTYDKAITEFPAYSFIVSDLHAHVLGLPLALLFLALMLTLFATGEESAGDNKPGRTGALVAAGLLLGLLYMTNAWSLPIYCLLGGLCLVALRRDLGLVPALKTVWPQVLLLGVLALASLYPFQADFIPFSKGLRLSPYATPAYQLCVLWGYQALVLVWFWRSLRGPDGRRRPLTGAEAFVGVIAITAVILVLLPEVVFVKDIYAGSYRRANTMFKLGFEAFTMLSVVIGYAAVAIANHPRPAFRQTLTSAVLIILLYLPLLFMWVALPQAYDLQTREAYHGLDGLRYLDQQEPGVRAAARWLQQQAPRGSVIIEAEGDSYSDAGRVSELTGLSTVLGWYVHEWLWRGQKVVVEERRREVKRVYEATKTADVWPVLRRYGVRYLILGKEERKRYPSLNPKLLRALGTVAFSAGQVEIIRLGEGPSPHTPADTRTQPDGGTTGADNRRSAPRR